MKVLHMGAAEMQQWRSSLFEFTGVWSFLDVIERAPLVDANQTFRGAFFPGFPLLCLPPPLPSLPSTIPASFLHLDTD